MSRITHVPGIARSQADLIGRNGPRLAVSGVGEEVTGQGHVVRGQNAVGVAPSVPTVGGEPPAVVQVLGRRTFADHHGVAEAVGDVRQADLGVNEEHPVKGGRGGSGHAEVHREGLVGDARLLGHLLAAGIRRAGVHLHLEGAGRVAPGIDVVRRNLPGLGGLVGVVLFDVRQNVGHPTPRTLGGSAPAAGVVVRVALRQRAVDIMEVVQGKALLLHVVHALSAGSSFPDLLNGRQQQANEDGNDRDHHQKLDQREATTDRRTNL